MNFTVTCKSLLFLFFSVAFLKIVTFPYAVKVDATKAMIFHSGIRAINSTEYLMIIFSYFSSKPYVVTPHLNRLIKTVQMRGHNICLMQN